MNFNQLILEALSDYKVIKRLTGKEALFLRFGDWIQDSVKECGGWLVHYDNGRYLYFYDLNSPDKLLKLGLSGDAHPDVDITSKNSELAIKHFELINGLKGKAKEAWKDILS
jgi:hypothetical protein